MASESFRAYDHKEWAAAGLDAVMERHEMEYCNQEKSGFDDLQGEWYVADDETRTIISGTFGNDHSPGSSHNTYAEVYGDEAEYRAALAEWEAKPEYTAEYEAESSAWSVVAGEDNVICSSENEEEARRIFRNYVGRASGSETVRLLHNEEVEEEHIGTTDSEATEPEEGDYTTTDHCHFYQYGKLVFTVPEDDDHIAALRAHMDCAKFWPSAWFVSDHGNYHPIDTTASA